MTAVSFHLRRVRFQQLMLSFGVLLLVLSSGCSSSASSKDNADSVPASTSGKRVSIGETNHTIEILPGYYIEKQNATDFEVYYFRAEDSTKTDDEAGIYFGAHPDTSAPSTDYTKNTFTGTFMGNSVTWTEYTTATYTQREVFIDNGPMDKIHCWCYSKDPAMLEKLYSMIKTIQ